MKVVKVVKIVRVSKQSLYQQDKRDLGMCPHCGGPTALGRTECEKRLQQKRDYYNRVKKNRQTQKGAA